MIDNLPAHKAAGVREAIEARRRHPHWEFVTGAPCDALS